MLGRKAKLKWKHDMPGSVLFVKKSNNKECSHWLKVLAERLAYKIKYIIYSSQAVSTGSISTVLTNCNSIEYNNLLSYT